MENYVIPGLYDLDLMDHAKGNRYYCLAHFYMQYEHYRDFFKQAKQDGKFITLDNSAAEKEIVTEQALLDIVDDLQPSEVIPPDVLFDKERTIVNFYSFMNKMEEKNRSQVDIFACPQGSTKKQWIECYRRMIDHPRVTVIGLSKISVPKCFSTITEDDQDVNIKEGRHACVYYLNTRGSITKPLHFLGMGDPTEYLYYQSPIFHDVRYLFRSTDSCYSVLAAVKEVDFEVERRRDGCIRRIKTTNDFYEHDLNEFEKELAIRNIQFLNKMLGD
jgi:hypothetical protein